MCSMKAGEPEDCDACDKRAATRVRSYPLPPSLSEGSPFMPVACYELQCWNCGRRGKHMQYVFVTPPKTKPNRRLRSPRRR